MDGTKFTVLHFSFPFCRSNFKFPRENYFEQYYVLYHVANVASILKYILLAFVALVKYNLVRFFNTYLLNFLLSVGTEVVKMTNSQFLLNIS